MTMGMKGGEVAEELLGNSTGANTVKQRDRSSLVEIIKTVVELKETNARDLLFSLTIWTG